MSASICTISNDQPDPQYQARRSKDNEPAQIPEQRIRYPDPNAMNADDPMDQHHVHELPDAKAKDRPGQEDAVGRTAITMAPEDQERSNCNHIDGNVKQTIRKDLCFEVLILLARDQTQEVMPLQHLVQENAIKESSQGEAKHGCGKSMRRRV